MLYGRDAELQLLSNFTSRSLAGSGGALLLRGEAVIGKTALLGAVITLVVFTGAFAGAIPALHAANTDPLLAIRNH